MGQRKNVVDRADVEEWRPVVGYEGWYEVSDCGKIRRIKPGRGITVGHILCPRSNSNSAHLNVQLCREGIISGRLVHRVVLDAFVGPAPQGCECRHLDGDPTNNHVRNLAWGTHKQNAEDMVAHGTSTTGERNAMAKLTARRAQLIRILYKHTGLFMHELAKAFGVAPATICRVVNRVSWRHV